MNLMSNARLFDDGQNKNDLIFLPQVKFNMMGQIQNQFQQEFKKRQSSPYSSPSPPSTSSSPSPNHQIPALLDKNPGSSPAPHQTPHFSEASTLHPARHPNPHQDHNDHQDHLNETGPLDFSNKKLKFEQGQGSKNRKRKETRYNSSQDNSSDEPDSPCSRLRNILKMKSPPGQGEGEGLVKEDRGTVLDLSKDNSLDNEIWNKGQKVTRPRSSSSSPSGLDLHSYLTGGRQSGQTFSFQSLGLSPYGILNSAQHSPMTTSVPYESPNYTQGGMSTAATFGPTLAPTLGPTLGPILGGPSQTTGTFASTAGMGKSRVTRPFKAYPKDPLTFPTVGLYGLPVVGPTPAVSEALIHQQSNHAYAEFRKQMLNQSNNSRSKRVGHSSKGYHPTGQEPLSDSTTSSTNPMDFGLGGGSEVMGTGSGEDCLSTSDDGYSLGIQSHSKNRLKSDEQLKDEAYWERRRKNNEAAKRSRDARRAKEDEIAIRAAFLEQENLKLRFEVCALKNERAKLQCMQFNYKGQ